jgi:hypothetical protein
MEQQELFSEHEVCSIEARQGQDVFDDIRDHMEDNYLELENMINKVKIEEETDQKQKPGYQYNFNKEGIYNMINVHEHLN